MTAEKIEAIEETLDIILRLIEINDKKQDIMMGDIDQLKAVKTPNDGSHTLTSKENKEHEELQEMAKVMMVRVKENAKKRVEDRQQRVTNVGGVKKAELKKKKRKSKKRSKKKRTPKKKSK
jgi:hypothetical protein